MKQRILLIFSITACLATATAITAAVHFHAEANLARREQQAAWLALHTDVVIQSVALPTVLPAEIPEMLP